MLLAFPVDVSGNLPAFALVRGFYFPNLIQIRGAVETYPLYSTFIVNC